jgi:hypothetical protein
MARSPESFETITDAEIALIDTLEDMVDDALETSGYSGGNEFRYEVPVLFSEQIPRNRYPLFERELRRRYTADGKWGHMYFDVGRTHTEEIIGVICLYRKLVRPRQA